MDLQGLQRIWNELGETDPLWAVLSLPDKRGGRWDLGEFMATGVHEIDELLAMLESSGIRPAREKALDFGCGVGRLTQPLAKHFEEAIGVDIAPSMIELANKMNKHPDRCRYVLNPRSDLSAFADGLFDLIYSNITLQHMPPALMQNYVAEFLRTVAPTGAIVFQLPTQPARTMRNRIKHLAPTPLRSAWRRWRHRLGSEARMQMYWMSPQRVDALVRRLGGRVVAAHDDYSAGPGWSGKRYVVQRSA